MATTNGVSTSLAQAKVTSASTFFHGRLHSVTTAIPIVSITSCILISALYHFDSVTKTHCGVPNWLPTISAAVGNNIPERYIFRLAIGVYTSMKYLYDYSCNLGVWAGHEEKRRKGVRLTYPPWLFTVMRTIGLAFAFIEDSMLLLLTMISSAESKEIHEFGFISFMLCAHIYFLFSTLAYKFGRSPFTESERKYFRARVIFALIHTSCVFLAAYLYWRHNAYCEPGVYSLFALDEYIIVLMNICFHGVGLIEFWNVRFVFDQQLALKEE